MARVYVDIETRSRVDLKRAGVYRYVRCPDFRILMTGWAVDDDPVRSIVGHDESAALLDDLLMLDPMMVAHNAAFERVCFSTAQGLPPGQYLPPEKWHDTQAMAAERGLPQSLEWCAKALGGQLKDSAGSDLIKLFCMPRRDGGWNDATTHPDEWLRFLRYCEQDVETLRSIDRQLGDYPTAEERDTYWVDQHINDRGIAIDVPMATAARREAERNQAEQRETVALLGVANVGSVPQVLAWAREHSIPMDNVQAVTVENVLREHVLEVEERQVLEARLEVALAAPAKYQAALDMQVEGRVRGALRFYGAHTGRWSGKGIQLQNLPRAHFDDEIEQMIALHDLMNGGRLTSLELKKLVRPMFPGPLTVVDFASIEARVIAWLAGERWAMDAFRKGRDIYVETANRMGGLTRAQGKIAVLALGYQGAVNSLKVMAGGVLYYDPNGNVVLANTAAEAVAKARDGIKGLWTDEDYLSMVRQWREANQRIVKFWYALEEAFVNGGPVGPAGVCVKGTGSGSRMTREIYLPSGRPLVYQGFCRKLRSKVDPKTGKVKTKMTPHYKPGNGGLMPTYGGRLAENVTQAVARDLLAAAMVRLEQRGYPVVAHVHDEVLIQGEHDVQEIVDIMCEAPSWAGGLPIAAEGAVCARYRKL